MKTEGRRRRRRGKKTNNPSRHAAPTNMSVSSVNSTVTRTPSNRTPSGRVGPGDSEGGADKSAGQHHRHCDTTTAGNRQMIYLSASTMVVSQWRRMTLCSHDPHQVSPSVSCSCFLLIILFVGCWTSGDLMAEASGSDGSSLCPLRRSCWGLWPPDSTSGQIKLLLINEAAGRRGQQHRGAEDNRTTVLHSESSLMSC